MKKIYCLLVLILSSLTSGFAQSDTTTIKNKNMLPSLKQVVYSADADAMDFRLALDLRGVNLVNHSLQNIKDGDFAISLSNLKMKNFFNRNDFRITPADVLKNIMPDYDLTSKPLPSRPLF
ncbi:hypothetical protein [Salegentibacter sp. Hel_I_6]|uniref:hypothetical protein n=1 Tax=Salegentibacter sp. Hel_I_6 TaxID=1250278 RepID=UPI00055E37C0|nr:hypothetical protein [Salegentibacter sp. Hel_I_6]